MVTVAKIKYITKDRKAPKLLDLVLLASEQQAAELLPLEADDEGGYQGGEESHQDAQRQVPAVCSEETQPLTCLMEADKEGSKFRSLGATNSTPLWQPCSSVVDDQTMSRAGCWPANGKLQPPLANIFLTTSANLI